MTPPLRLAVLGAWHVHAKDYARGALEHPGTELLAVWDDDAVRGSALAETMGAEFTGDLPQLLARPDLDGVIVTVATRDHDEVIGAAITADKHVYTEKLLSPTVQGCRDLIRRAEEAGVLLAVSLPRLAHGYTLALRDLLEGGTLGRLTYARVRLAHNGSIADSLPHRFYDRDEALGGAFTDLGAHPAYLLQLILGTEFSSVVPTFTDMTGRGVEDNASVTVTTADGAIGVIETGFVTPRSPLSIEVHGTEGSALYGVGTQRLLHGSADGWHELPLPEPAPHPFAQWVQAVASGTPLRENLERATELTRLIAAANAAAR